NMRARWRCARAATGRPLGKRLRSQENRRTIKEVVMNFWARTIAVMISSIAGDAMSHAAELTVLASQSNLRGVNELATAFARAQGIAQLCLTEQLKPKIVLTGGGTGPVTFFLARGDFELGIQQSNIMVRAPGTDFVGPVPGSVNIPCPNSVGLLTVSKERDAAQAMIKFMISPAAAPLLRRVHEEAAKG